MASVAGRAIWVAVAISMAWIIYLELRAIALPHPGPNGGPAVIDPLEIIKTTITVAGFVGAVLVGLYGYRKQRLVEGASMSSGRYSDQRTGSATPADSRPGSR